jgi:hypothetical protein
LKDIKEPTIRMGDEKENRWLPIVGGGARVFKGGRQIWLLKKMRARETMKNGRKW